MFQPSEKQLLNSILLNSYLLNYLKEVIFSLHQIQLISLVYVYQLI